jgi:ABC-type lipoprotein export system ATPase subunit
MASGTILARVSGLSYRYAPHEPVVLHDISLTIREGEIVVLTGPSGSGKTTLLSLLGMLRRVDAGHIRLFDIDVGGANALEIAALRRRVRFIFQKHYLLRSLTALQNVIAGVVATISRKGISHIAICILLPSTRRRWSLWQEISPSLKIFLHS